MDAYSENLRQNIEMEKYSTEIISKSYSDVLLQNDPGTYDNIEHYYMAEDNGSEAEICRMESENSKLNISNATTAQLSAQIMNLPYDKFNESILSEAPKSPKESIYDEYYIFKKIRDAYAACACKICKCLTGTTISNRIEFCNCEPCKCKDCALHNNLRINNSNFQLCLGNKTCNRIDQIKEVNDVRCDCKPCDCIECSQHSSLLRPDYRVNNKIKDGFVKIATKSHLGQSSPQHCNPTHETIDTNKFKTCKIATCLNAAYEVEKIKPRQCSHRDEAPSKQTEMRTNGCKEYITTLNNKQPVTKYHSHSNKKCVCTLCECVVCECNENALTCGLKATPFENILTKNVGFANSKPSFRKNRVILQSTENSACKCEICSCIQCEWHSELKNKDCNCYQCHDESCEGSCKTPDYGTYPDNKRSCMLRKKPLSYKYNEYTQLTKSRAQSNLMTADKTKYGNIYYVSNNKTKEMPNKILTQVQSTMTENKSDKAVHKRSDQIIKNVDNKFKQRKWTPFDNAMKTTTRRPNSRTSKNSVKDVAESVLSASLGKNEPVTKPGKTCLKVFYPGCRSTQTHFSKSSSSLLQYQNNGCCAHTISLPDTNIVDDFTSTKPEPRFYENRNYQTQHDIYHCCQIKKYLNKTNAAKLVHPHQNNIDDRKTIFENDAFEIFDKKLTKNPNNLKTERDKVDHESAYKTLRKARKFTVYLTKILKKYEKANSEFESVSEKLKKLQYVMFDKANNNFKCQDCESIETSKSVCSKQKNDTDPNESFLKINCSFNLFKNHANAIEVNNNGITSCKENEIVVEPFQIVKCSRKENSKKLKKTVKISEPKKDTPKEIKIDSETKTIWITSTDQLHDKEPCNGATNITPPIKSTVIDNPKVSQDAIEKREASEVELLRMKKILNILKQNTWPDVFTEHTSSPGSMLPMTEQLGQFTFNYHTKTLMRSTIPSILL